ncbi:MAG: DinB family protein [Acidobacteria bacterium]|nr:DinB family protein [Acidobacteriota bacterium]
MHADIQSVVEQLAQANRWAELLSRETFVTPTGGAWTAPQCLEHLAKTNTLYTAAIRDAVAPVLHLGRPAGRKPIRPGWPSRLFIERMEPGTRNQFRAVDSVQPARDAAMPAALKEFLRSQQAVESLLYESADLDLNRIRFRNPFVHWIRFTAGAGFLIIAAHNRRHLAQAQRLCQHQGNDTPTVPRSRAATGGRSA